MALASARYKFLMVDIGEGRHDGEGRVTEEFSKILS